MKVLGAQEPTNYPNCHGPKIAALVGVWQNRAKARPQQRKRSNHPPGQRVGEFFGIEGLQVIDLFANADGMDG